MSPELFIRPAHADDADGLQHLYQDLATDQVPCPPERAREILEKIPAYEGSAVLLGRVDNALATSCTLIVIPNLTRGGASYALIENVVTRADLRGRGYGKAILDAATARAWELDCYKIMLSTGSKRPSTLAFYEAAGFEQSRTGFQKRRLPRRS